MGRAAGKLLKSSVLVPRNPSSKRKPADAYVMGFAGLTPMSRSGARAALPILLAALLLFACPAPAADCLHADGTDQVVEGKLQVGRFRNYTGRLVPAYILELRQPACL